MQRVKEIRAKIVVDRGFKKLIVTYWDGKRYRGFAKCL